MADTLATLESPRRESWRRALARLRGAPGRMGRVLTGGGPGAFAPVPPDPWMGSADRGATIVQDRFLFNDAGHRPDWSFLDHVADDMASLHGFDWLRDVRTVGGDLPRRRAVMLIDSWIHTHGRWHGDSWRADILGSRITAWLGQHDFFASHTDRPFRTQFRESVARQARALARTLPGRVDGLHLVQAIKGLIYAGLAFPGQDKWRTRGLHLLDRQLERQFLADGGHLSRCPATHATMLRHMIDIRNVLRARGADMPERLIRCIDRAAPFLRMMRHGDGNLAGFNGGGTVPGWLLDTLLVHADARGRAPGRAPHSGFERIAANRTLLLMDTGRPPPPGMDENAHAGTLSFEMSVGRERVIVNCGHHAVADAWGIATRTTAAHSTLVVENANSTEVLAHGGLGRRPGRVSVERNDAAGAVWLDAAHDGYAAIPGLIHRRRLYVSADGEDVRGEDRLARVAPGGHAVAFVLRFHLHPAVAATCAADGALLQLASGSRYRLRAAGGTISVEPGVYIAEPGRMTPSHQIVVAGHMAAGAEQRRVKWAIQRIPATP